MKWVLPMLLLAPVLQSDAQTDGRDLIVEGLRNAVTITKKIPEQEVKPVLDAAAKFIQEHIAFRPDGSAAALYTCGKLRKHIEWKKLRFSSINRGFLTDADKTNGITKRYHVVLICDSHRRWAAKENRWTEWQPGRFIFLPAVIRVEETKGKLVVWPGRFEDFRPGTATAPAGKARSLSEPPPGMERIK